jgi:hypothetical protein
MHITLILIQKPYWSIIATTGLSQYLLAKIVLITRLINRYQGF